MKTTIEPKAWSCYLTEFNERNQSRPTWLQIFGEAGAQSEELGLSLSGISLETKGIDAPTIQIMFGGKRDSANQHLTHVIRNVTSVMPKVGADGRDESIEIIDKNGEASLLIFQHRAKLTAHA